jgi:hypothetical protein
MIARCSGGPATVYLAYLAHLADTGRKPSTISRKARSHRLSTEALSPAEPAPKPVVWL